MVIWETQTCWDYCFLLLQNTSPVHLNLFKHVFSMLPFLPRSTHPLFFSPPPWCVSVFPFWHVQDLRLTSSLRPFIRCHLCLFALHLPFFPLPVFDFKSSLRRAIAHKRRGLSTVSAMLAHILIFQLNRNARSFGIILLGSSVCFRTALHFANRL